MPSKKDLEKALKDAERDLKGFKKDLKNEISASQKKFYESMISSTENLVRALKKRIKELN